jgi:hypothetical protein
MSETTKAERANMTSGLDFGNTDTSEVVIAMPEAVQEAVRQALPSMVEAKVREIVPPVVEERVRELMPSLVEDLAEGYGLSTEVTGLLHLVASKSNDSHEALLRKALTLYNVALDARDNGNRLAILNPEDIIVREIMGFETSVQHRQPVGP